MVIIDQKWRHGPIANRPTRDQTQDMENLLTRNAETKSETKYKSQSAAALPHDARAFYEREGYYLAKGVLPESLLARCQNVLERWVDDMAAKWKDEGRIQHLFPDLPFRSRFDKLWREAGCPPHERSPRKPLVDLAPEEVYEILRDPALADLAETFLGTSEIASHSAWNSRPKCPDARFTDTPWHQDGQYFRDEAHIHIMTVWFPLHAVDAASSCLAVSSDLHHRKLFENFLYEDNGFVGIRREEAKGLTTIPIAMEPGDALCFPQLTPHRAMPNETDLMRWSMDLRFLSADRAMPGAMKQGLVVRSKDPSRITSFSEWKKKWE